jgi:adenosylcobinamide kinase/adenosylcobinamide-phosphate guanylyltransferase
MLDRVARHRENRPESWQVLERWETLLEALKTVSKRRCRGLMLDGLGVYLARRYRHPPTEVLDEIDVFAKSCRHQAAYTVVTADETGLGGVPGHPAARKFADLNGLANQALARHADEVYFSAAGLARRMKP